MDISILVALLFALGLITVIGHGIWVLLATIYRAIFSDPQTISVFDKTDARPDFNERCAECGASLRPDDIFCAVCGRAQLSAGPVSGPIVDLAMTARQLDKFLNQGRLYAETHDRVMQVIE